MVYEYLTDAKKEFTSISDVFKWRTHLEIELLEDSQQDHSQDLK